MAKLYDKNDIVRLIVKSRGYCIDNNQKNAGNSDYFGDLSPACMGLAINDTKLENVIAIFNPSSSSYRVFNEIHISEGDRNLTIGCGNYANSPLAKMFLDMPMDTWIEFRGFVADKLLGDQGYFKQYSQDYVVKSFLGNRQQSELQKKDVLESSIDYFFARDLLNGKTYSDIHKNSTLTSRYKYNGKSWTITKSAKSYLSLWGDTVLLLAAIDSQTGKPSAQYDVYPNYSDSPAKLACTKFIDKDEDKSSSPVCVRLFPGHEKDNGKCSFWFYAILSEALLIKSVADWQHKNWVNNYYNDCLRNLHTLNGKEQAILTGLVSWKSSGLTINDNPPFALANGASVDNWRNLGNKYYLKSAKEVLVNNKQKDYLAKQAIINACIGMEGELFTALIIWAQFIMTKEKIRSRIRAMWNAYFDVPFKKYKDRPDTSFNANEIKKVELKLTAESLVLKITEKKSKMAHSYTFIKPADNNTNNNA